MSFPTPPVPLDGHCSVIYNNTLYAFQSTAFQSLPLTQGARWSQLPMGTAVRGARCVQATYQGQDALFVVGGTTNDSSLQTYPGLQRYTFADRSWASNTPQASVTQNRQMHGAAFLNSTSSILIYAGFQDGVYVNSSQTFTISTSDPYVTQAFTSDAPPVINPLLLPWNQSHAVLLGGNPVNNEVWTFSEADGWQQANVTLPSGLPNISEVQGTIIETLAGTKVLQLFNMSVSPNEVSTFLLQSTDDAPISSRDISSGLPSYNATFAPTAVRSGFSIAQGSSGLVVISGGAAKNIDQDLCVFNETDNGWINANHFFAVASPSVIPTPMASSSATAIPSNAASPTGGKSQPLLIVGAVLGSVFGFAALCIIALLMLRYVRQKRRRKARSSPFLGDTKDQMDFIGRGDGSVTPSAALFGNSSHNASVPARNTSSLFAIGKTQQPKRGIFHAAGDSAGSASSLYGRKPSSPVVCAPKFDPGLRMGSPVEREAISLSPEPRTAPRTDEGWSTYFNNNNATDLTTLPPGYTRYETPSRPDTYTTASQSDYTSSRVVSSNPHGSAEVAPLNIRASLYPPSENTWENSQHLHPNQTGPARRHLSSAGPFSHIPEESDDFLHDGSSGQDSWTPVATSDRGSAWGDRAQSSVYDSAVYPHPGDRVRIPDFPGVPNSNRTSQTTVIPADDSRGLRSIAAKDFPGGLARSEGRQSPEISASGRPTAAMPGLKAQPRPAGDASGRARDRDLSWLNLGTS
ncbi:hypothetical protein MMC19_001019 [Ptychographa xylographoides]|nr:hypothetical protein [Ptychographa xylographoides]